MKGYLYILRSKKNGLYYIGCSKNIEGRLKQHNGGQVKSTRHKRPFQIVLKQDYPSINIAHKVEL